VNIMGENFSEYIELVKALDGISGIAGVEVNISCPNVEAGGLEFGQDPRLAGELIKAIRDTVQLPILVKLTPSVADPRIVAASVAKAGADALTIFNTIPGMAIDIDKRKPTLGATFGGLSGPAIKPVALRHVFLVSGEMDIPIVASGGVVSGTDVVEFIMAGASAVQVGTATFVRPDAAWHILDELVAWCDSNGIRSLSEILGAAK
jgi:dihydroorotate dehydrogenase (NAD+) catalytic subunit